MLDLVITNDTNSIIEVLSSKTSLSDHNLVEVRMGYDVLGSTKTAPPKKFERFSFHSLNIHEADTEALKDQGIICRTHQAYSAPALYYTLPPEEPASGSDQKKT